MHTFIWCIYTSTEWCLFWSSTSLMPAFTKDPHTIFYPNTSSRNYVRTARRHNPPSVSWMSSGVRTWKTWDRCLKCCTWVLHTMEMVHQVNTLRILRRSLSSLLSFCCWTSLSFQGFAPSWRWLQHLTGCRWGEGSCPEKQDGLQCLRRARGPLCQS